MFWSKLRTTSSINEKFDLLLYHNDQQSLSPIEILLVTFLASISFVVLKNLAYFFLPKWIVDYNNSSNEKGNVTPKTSKF